MSKRRYLRRKHSISSRSADFLLGNLFKSYKLSRFDYKYSTLQDFYDDYNNGQYNYKDVKQSVCADYTVVVPVVENLVGDEWCARGVSALGFPATLNRGDEYVLQEDGIIMLVPYNHFYKLASQAFNNFENMEVNQNVLMPLYSSIVFGIVAIESFLNMIIYKFKTDLHGNFPVHPSSKKRSIKIDDYDKWFHLSMEDKVDSFADSFGIQFVEKGKRNWAAFKRLVDFRNDYVIHVKNPVLILEESKILQLINDFQFGISKLLFELHNPQNYLVIESPSGTLLRDMVAPQYKIINENS